MLIRSGSFQWTIIEHQSFASQQLLNLPSLLCLVIIHSSRVWCQCGDGKFRKASVLDVVSEVCFCWRGSTVPHTLSFR